MLVAQRELHRQETTLRLTSDQRNDKVIKLYTSCSRQTQDFHTPTTVQTRCRLPYSNHPTTHILKKKTRRHTQSQSLTMYTVRDDFLLHIAI